MFNNPLSAEVIQELMERLLPLYPNEAEKATDILLKEYEFPTNIAYFIMSLVSIQKSKEEVLHWPIFDARYSGFGLN